MKRKIIFLLFLFIMAMPVLSSASGYNSYDERLTLLNHIGVVSEDNTYEGALTRAEFVKIIADFIPEKMYYENVEDFEDVPDSHEEYEKIVQAKGLGYISSDGNYFYPDDEITPVDALVILIKMIGMDGYAEAMGGYPNGYYRTAERIDILDGTSFENGVDWENTVILLSNLLLAPSFDITTTQGGMVTLETDSEETILNRYFNMYRVEGRVEAAGKTTIHYEMLTSENTVTVDGVSYDAYEDFSSYIGKNVAFYYSQESVRAEAKAVFMVTDKKDRSIKINSHDIESCESGRLEYILDDKTLNIKLSEYADVIYNGRFDPDYRVEELTKLYSADVEFVSYENNSIYNLIIINEYRQAVIQSVDIQSGIIYFSDKTVYGREIKSIKPDNYELTDNLGIKMNLADLKEGYLLAVSTDRDNEFVKMVVSDEKIRGMASISEDEIYIDGTRYLFSRDFDREGTNISPSVTYVYYIDMYGCVAAVDDSYIEGEYYGYMTNLYLDEITFEDVMLKVFEESGEFKTYKLKKRIYLNGSKIDSEMILEHPFFTNIDGINMQLLRYRVSNGEINSIDTAEDMTIVSDYQGYDTNKFTRDYYSASSGFFRYSSKVLNNRYILDPETRIFVLPQDKKDLENYEINDLSMFSTDSSTLGSVEVYDSDELKNAAVIILTPTAREYNVNTFVVKKIIYQLDENEEARCYLTGFVAGAEQTYKLNEYLAADISAGDVLRIAVKDSEIVQYQMVYSVKDKDIDKEPSDMLTTNSAGGAWVTVCGTVKKASDNSLTIMIDGKLSPLAYPLHSSGTVYNYFSNGGRVETGDFADIAEGARVFIRRYYDSAREIIVYR